MLVFAALSSFSLLLRSPVVSSSVFLPDSLFFSIYPQSAAGVPQSVLNLPPASLNLSSICPGVPQSVLNLSSIRDAGTD